MAVVDLLSSLSHQTRIDIIHLLSKRGELCVNDVAGHLRQSQALVSKHLITLKDAGAIKVEKQQSKRIYSLKGREILDLLQVASNLAEA